MRDDDQKGGWRWDRNGKLAKVVAGKLEAFIQATLGEPLWHPPRQIGGKPDAPDPLLASLRQPLSFAGMPQRRGAMSAFGPSRRLPNAAI
jgi:hypothetical protein